MEILQAGSKFPGGVVVFYVLLLLVFYLLLIRPQQVQQRRRREMLGKLRRGDRIVTVGGLHATIHDMDDDATMTLELAPGLRVKADRTAVAHVRTRKEPEPVQRTSTGESPIKQ